MHSIQWKDLSKCSGLTVTELNQKQHPVPMILDGQHQIRCCMLFGLLAAVSVVSGPRLFWAHSGGKAPQDDHGRPLALAMALLNALGHIPDCR